MNEPVCQYLRTKKLFIPEGAVDTLSEPTEPEAEPLYWCNQTLKPIGPDDQPAHLRLCVKGRCCFEK